jgi:hypothetical protein
MAAAVLSTACSRIVNVSFRTALGRLWPRDRVLVRVQGNRVRASLGGIFEPSKPVVKDGNKDDDSPPG